MADIFAALDEFDADYKNTKLSFGDDKPWDTPLEDGFYKAILEDVCFTQSKSGNPMVKWEFKLPSEKRKHWKYNVLNLQKPMTTGMLKRDMKAAGLELSDNLRQDVQSLKKLINNEYEIEVKTKNGFTETLFVKQLLGDDDVNF